MKNNMGSQQFMHLNGADLKISSDGPNENGGAILSGCGKYRFKLWRIWDVSQPKVLWIMHNPSTADALKDDPTIRRCINYSKQWGYGGIMVGNLFPFRATYPKELINTKEDIYMYEENVRSILEMYSQCELYMLAHGNLATQYKCMSPLVGMKNWRYLKLTKKNQPCHPLYLKKDLIPSEIRY